MLLDPGLSLTLRPMRYPDFFEGFKSAIKNTWTVDEVDFANDLPDLHKISDAERHLIHRLVAFFATGDTIVGNNIALSLYQHINAPEARMYLGRQLYEEMLHVQFYLTLLDTYIPDPDERNRMFQAVENVPSISKKAEFCAFWTDDAVGIGELSSTEKKRAFLLNLIAYGGFVEGLFFYAAFAYVYFLRSKGLLNALASGTDWVFRDESMHMMFCKKVVDEVRKEEPWLFTGELERDVGVIAREAYESEALFAEDLLGGGIAGLSVADMRTYLRFVTDQRLELFGFKPVFNQRRHPLTYMDLQDVQELANFFERRVSAYQMGDIGNIPKGYQFDDEF